MKYKPPLDPDFSPAVLFNQEYKKKLEGPTSKSRETFYIAIESSSGNIFRYETDVIVDNQFHDLTVKYLERTLKFLLWSIGGWRVMIVGPSLICQTIKELYSLEGKRKFDVELMSKVYGKDFRLEIVASKDDLPATKQSSAAIGGHLDGCRIGFDLGASDYKLAAVIDGEVAFSTEIPWTPVTEPDPNYHYNKIREGLKLAASKLPRVDCIGGSSAGIIVENQVKIASLFRSVSPEKFKEVVGPIFLNIQKEWNVPQVVINDGDVSALAGAMSLEKNAILGLAMGSSEAVGYISPEGTIGGLLNELAFAPVDFNESTIKDEWSGDYGVGAQYFSQQSVNKLLPAAGITLPDEMPLPEKLKEVQKMVEAGHEGAEKIYETIGVYLGYTIPHYLDYYDFESLLLLGRVTSGTGGEIIVKWARKVFEEEFPELAAKVSIIVPDERSRRVGQAVAAASLPKLK